MPYSRNKALEAAYRKGLAARAAGLPLAENPYPDRRTGRGCVTFARAFRTAWVRGWSDGAEPSSLPVLAAAECPPCACCGEPWCAVCQMHYAECRHPGPSSETGEPL